MYSHGDGSILYNGSDLVPFFVVFLLSPKEKKSAMLDGDPFGHALYDFSRGEQNDPLIQRDGENTREHPIELFYFEGFDSQNPQSEFLESWVDGPLLDMGAGAGRDTLHFQEKFETVAIERSRYLVKVMEERGVTDARHADMFTLPQTFERDRFQSAFAWGTQVGLAHSMKGLQRFLEHLDLIIASDGTTVLDCYDPEHDRISDLLGYREDPTEGLAHRVMCFEYQDTIGETLLFRLFSPDRLREAATGTNWEVAEIARDSNTDSSHYQAALTKE